MKALKRNAVIITVLLFVCVAVYLNWYYNQQEEQATQLAASTSLDGGEAASASGSAGREDSGGLFYVSKTVTGEEPGQENAAPSDTAGEADNAAGGSALPSREEYFAAVRLSREQARAQATETLQVVSSSEEGSQDSIDAALMNLVSIADRTVKEAEIESMIRAKGYEDCVVFISDNGITVTVAAPIDGLSVAGAAQIADIVMAETGCQASALRIVEIK